MINDPKFFFSVYLATFLIALICTMMQEALYSLSGKQLVLIYITCQAGLATSATLLIQCNRLLESVWGNETVDHGTKIGLLISIEALKVLALIFIGYLCNNLLKNIRRKIRYVVSKNIVPQNERNVNMLGSFITHRRQELGLSLAKLAKISGHPVSSIHGIENGDNQNPRFEMIIDLCQALDVSLDEMKAAFIDKEPQNTNHK